MSVRRPIHWNRVWPVLAVLAAALVLEVPLSAQTGLTVHQVARLRTVVDAIPSPDGSRVAFTRAVSRTPLQQPDGPSWVELHVVGPDGSERGFVTGDVNVAAPAWTPDGRRVSFLGRRTGDSARSLYAIAVDGGEARRILQHTTDISQYAWRPDGRALAFVAPEPMATEIRALEQKGFNQIIYEERPRPQRLWIADVGAGGEVGSPRLVDVAGSMSRPRWSPSGDRIAVGIAPTSLIDDGYMQVRLHVIDPAAGRVAARFENPGKLGDYRWSPDGTRLAVISAADPNDPLEGRLVVVSATGGAWPGVDVLQTFLPHGHVKAVEWRGASELLWLADEGVGVAIGRVQTDGSGAARTWTSQSIIARSLAVGPDETMTFVADSADHPADVFAIRAGARAPVRLTTSNPWLSGVALGRQEIVRYKARDGLELDGLLIHPVGAPAGQPHPLIVVVHGGPEAHYSNGWLTSYSTPGQAGAARGFAVFYPNYRGSTGRGIAFSKLSQGDPAGKEFDDVVDGVDHLVNAGLVDRARVGVTGGSYGGYASAWAATYYSDRFAASVMFVGISNTISKVGTSDIPYELNMVHYRSWPWEDWQKFLERSPIYHVDKARTPLLILHGDSDPRVPPSQSMELYRHMKIRTTTPVRLVLYPGEGHGNARAASRLDVNLRLMRWMEHYLKGPGGAMPAADLAYDEPEPAAVARD